MIEKKFNEAEIKNNIKELISTRGEKITNFSLKLGYSKSFLSTVLNDPKKSFSLQHIYRICEALDYPVWKLFVESDHHEPYPKEEISPPKVNAPQEVYSDHPPEAALVFEKLRALSPETQQRVWLEMLGRVTMLEKEEALKRGETHGTQESINKAGTGI